jgi:hypothetical protein
MVLLSQEFLALRAGLFERLQNMQSLIATVTPNKFGRQSA